MLTELTDKLAPVLDGSNYPQRWQDFIGQEAAVKMLRVAAKSARIRKAPLAHTLIAHPMPGVGKTALASLVAREMKTEVRLASGQLGRDQARLLFASMEDRQVLVYDEIHQLMDGGRKMAEWMLQYLQDGEIVGPLGPEAQPQVTIIGATTDPQKLPPALLSRFGLRPPMRDYTNEEAARIAKIHARGILDDLPPLHSKDALVLATAASRNPRAIRHLLTMLRDLVVTEELEVTEAGRYDIDGLLDYVGVTHDGLDPVAQAYLRALAVEFGGSAGAKALEDRLQQAGGLVQIERTLMDAGLIAKTTRGRTLTQQGIKRYRELEAS